MVIDPFHHQPLYLDVAGEGQGGGERDMIGDYYEDPYIFRVAPVAGQVYQIKQLRFHAGVSGGLTLSTLYYGSDNSEALDFPILMAAIESLEGTTDPTQFQYQVDFTHDNNIQIFTHFEWTNYGFVAQSELARRFASPGALPQIDMICEFEDQYGAPLILDGNRGGQLIVQVAEDMGSPGSKKNLVNHKLVATGIQYYSNVEATALEPQKGTFWDIK